MLHINKMHLKPIFKCISFTINNLAIFLSSISLWISDKKIKGCNPSFQRLQPFIEDLLMKVPESNFTYTCYF